MADQFKLGVQEKGYVEDQNNGTYGYPAPQMVQPGFTGQTSQTNLTGGTHANNQRPLNAGATRVVLPPDFLGAWAVQGQRTKVEAMPEFQQAAEGAFAINTSNVWRIGGNPSSGYTMGNDQGVSTTLYVDKVQGGTAFIRYQHPVNNTMAQEAIVMSLLPGGAQFNGLERISIVKQGLPEPRAKVTYQLIGHRQ